MCVSNLCSLHCFNGYIINCGLFNRVVSSLDYIVSDDSKWPKLRVLSQYLPTGNEENHKYLCQDDKCPGKDSNWAPPENK